MLRRLLGLLTLIPCDCGHDAADHEPPCAFKPWDVCGPCSDLARDGGIVDPRHPYAVRRGHAGAR